MCFLPFSGQLRSWICPPNGRNTSPHCFTRRSPPSTQPISVASCRSHHPRPHHAFSEPCPKWKRTQGWERWEQTHSVICREFTNRVHNCYKASSCKPSFHASLTQPLSHTYTHRPLFKGMNAEWRQTGPQAACYLGQSMQMQSDKLAGISEFTEVCRTSIPL